MDALPILEQTGLPFASKHAGVMHACGHDSHTAMALGAAMILAELRGKLHGTLKFLFQPSEEKAPGGAQGMIEEGALKNPDVAAIFGQHVDPHARAGTTGFRPVLYSQAPTNCTLQSPGKADTPQNRILLSIQLSSPRTSLLHCNPLSAAGWTRSSRV